MIQPKKERIITAVLTIDSMIDLPMMVVPSDVAAAAFDALLHLVGDRLHGGTVRIRHLRRGCAFR